ncbi:chromate resistance protein [Hydrogenophaga crassostreae]|uniref:Chromate resistance protein n=1 Tax=Hydrogenophaga crassostreae TaxID=1763535 RepID=A0A162SQ21_9BURK|nr:chromate resistance protein ChrB domain-containing protein [Hydrogenophaga crassostreae]AOW11536.1 chromate resistance protein [Hydrogenophaga crassostreae]OAD39374.1 chromate resistance protein [Hydrogenophaga crassostreae]
MSHWISLITSLPTANSTVRMRTWRALKASGAAVLRDGVYLLPGNEACRTGFEALAADVVAAGGTALVMRVEPPDDTEFEPLFDRSGDYEALSQETLRAFSRVSVDTAAEQLKVSRKLRKSFALITTMDFFPGSAQAQVDAQLTALELACARAMSPNEPQVTAGEITARHLADHQGRTWVTRERPWADRLASAWLIQRFIDPKARIRWLADPADRPAKALGFDFDGADFTHVGHCVTFEVLMASFDLKQPGLARLATLVHYLDAGGLQPAEAVGLEAVLTGLRSQFGDDNALLAAAGLVFDSLLVSFSSEAPAR